MTTEHNDQPSKPTESDNLAMDGMLREYARTGTSGDDESFIAAINDAVQSSVAGVQRERDWPWLFGRHFWTIAASILVVCSMAIGGRSWTINTAQADPTEVHLFSRGRVLPGEPASVRVLVRDARNQKPVSGAQVRLSMIGADMQQELVTATTNSDGIADITAELEADMPDGEYQWQANVSGSTGEAEARQAVSVTRSFRTMLSSDKPKYQPGQIIHMRALSLDTDTLQPATGRSIAFAVRDAKGNKVFGKSATTTNFGIAAADFKLASQVNEGSYTIAVTIGDTTSERNVSVERYVLPKFKVDLAADRGFYAPRDIVDLTLDSNYTFGKPVPGAAVTIRADEFIEKFRTFRTIQGTTDADGRFSAQLALKEAFVGQPLNKGDAFVRLVAEVTDATGETQQQTLKVIVTDSPIRIEVFPESGELVQNVENRLYVVTTRPDGSPLPAVVETGHGVTIETNEVGIGKLKLTPTRTDMKLTLTARDPVTGAESRAIRQLRVDQRLDGLLLRTDRAVYRQGETANLTVLSASRARRVFVDAVRNGRTVTSTSIELSDRTGTHAFDLPTDLAGSIQLQAYAILEDGEIVRDTKLIQVHQADQLQIEATLDAETYKPAQKALIKFLVTSKNGDPVAAALSLAAVDEAVFAMNDARPGLEEMYFLIQEEILKPRYQFVTQPRSDFVSMPAAQPDRELEEANVIRFSAAEGTGEAAPNTTTGVAFAEKQEQVLETRLENWRFRMGLLGAVPFWCFMLFSVSFLVYGVSRVRFKSAVRVERPAVQQFRSLMRIYFWTLVGLIGGLPLLVLFLASMNFQSSIVFWIVVIYSLSGMLPLVWLTQSLRGLTHTQSQTPLFRKLVWGIPAIYGLAVLTFVGSKWASEFDQDIVASDVLSQRLFIVVAMMLAGTGVVGFLRKTLSESRTIRRNIVSLVFGQVALLTPMLVLSSSESTESKTAVGMENADRFMMRGDADDAMQWDLAGMDGIMDGEMLPFETAMSLVVADNPQGLDDQPTPPRVRRFFPETLLWRPQLLTDESGNAQLELSLADSITTWRLAGSAVSKSGQLGSFEQGIRVFQDFFIDIDFPAELTQNDEVTIPIAVFNYLDETQTIKLEASQEGWFELVDDSAQKSISALPGTAMKASYRIRVLKPGRHALTVTAIGTKLSDAVERTVRVVPDGTRIEQVVNAKLNQAVREKITIPANAIEGGSDLFVKVYPGAFSQVLEGMDSIFRMPNGCFEQTSSTTYPNVLVLNYLRETGQPKPEIEMKALEFINAGYQRLLSYEVDGGGFEWFGSPPAHNILTAYGLMEFVDMAKVFEIDPDVVTRTRAWLLTRREANGSWVPSSGGIAEGAINNFRSPDAVLRATAYITWAIAQTGDLSGLEASLAFLENGVAEESDPYTLALIANAFVSADRVDDALKVIGRIDDVAIEKDEFLFWNSAGEGVTYGRGASFDVETTALVVQAMLRTQSHSESSQKALDWLISKRDGSGTWHSTQATIQAMRALLLAATSSVGAETNVTVTITANGQAVAPLKITKENSDVFHLISLTEFVRDGENEVALRIDGEASLACQVVGIHYAPRTAEPAASTPVLQIETDYSTQQLATDDLLKVRVTLNYHRPERASMTLVDLGIPPGFDVEIESFRKLVETGLIRRFEPKGRQVTLYFDSIPGDGVPVAFEYSLRAKFPVKAQAPASVAYQYYEPEIRDESSPVLLTVQ
ncbi:MAG: MG2 domain-containing protein [Planctomycetales bacterium]